MKGRSPAVFGSWSEVIRYLAETTNYEKGAAFHAGPRSWNLRRTRELLSALADPQETFPALHIAGTKGKGSTAHFTEAILRAEGLKTGLYTSPHLVDPLERIRIDGRSVSRNRFVRVMNTLKPFLAPLQPTWFEIMTVAAFRIFAEERVDMAVVETGLGGRLDATRLCRPVGCAITRIDRDHTKILGNTLGAIAREKAGIMKKGVPVVVAPQRPAAMKMLRSEARRIGSPILPVPAPQGVRNVVTSGRIVVDFAHSKWKVRLAVPGAHQAENFSSAIELVRTFLEPSSGAIRKAAASVRLPGRFERIGRKPDLIVDVAHNPASMRALVATLEALYPGRRRVAVFGCALDKDGRGMLRALSEGVHEAVFPRLKEPRMASPERLQEWAGSLPSNMERDLFKSVEKACEAAGASGVVVVTGSFVPVGLLLGGRR